MHEPDRPPTPRSRPLGRSRVAALVALLLAAPALASGPPADPERRAAREAAARRYLAVVTPLSMMEDVSLATFRGLPPVEAHELAKAFVRELQMDEIERRMLDTLVAHFTVAELDALTAFYASRHGSSAMAKMNDYMADLMPAMQGEVQRALAVVRAREGQPVAAPAP